jgi:E3 ubiquitin-protein ligase RBX1
MTKIQFKIKKIDLTSEWCFDTHNDLCCICRNSIMNKSVSASLNDKDILSKPIVGECNHAFHSDCINAWTRQRRTCPLCNKIWKLKTIINENYVNNLNPNNENLLA